MSLRTTWPTDRSQSSSLEARDQLAACRNQAGGLLVHCRILSSASTLWNQSPNVMGLLELVATNYMDDGKSTLRQPVLAACLCAMVASTAPGSC